MVNNDGLRSDGKLHYACSVIQCEKESRMADRRILCSLFSVLSRVHAHVHLGRITMFVAETKHHGDIVVVIVRLMTGNMFHQPATLDLRNLGMLGAMRDRND